MSASPFLISINREDKDTVGLPKLVIKNFHKIGLKPNEWYFYSFISYLESERKPIPPQEELAEMLGFSERQLKEIVASLKRKGLLQVNRNKNKKKYNFKPLIDRAKRAERESEYSFLLLAEVGD